MNRIVTVLILIPLAIVLIALAVANRGAVPFTIDPFNPGSAGLTVNWPLFAYLFVALLLGIVIGSCATWVKQGRYRKLARERGGELRTRREQPAPAVHEPGLPVPRA